MKFMRHLKKMAAPDEGNRDFSGNWQEGTFNARKRFGSGDDVVEIFCELYANCLTHHLLPPSNSLSTIAERTRSKAV